MKISLPLTLALLTPALAWASGSTGERLAYVAGCINCHHQTPKEIINAPPLLVVQGYTLAEFQRLMRTGVTRAGRDMLAESSVMGIVAKEQFSHLTPGEVQAIYEFLSRKWTSSRAAAEEAKIPQLYKAHLPPPVPAK